MHINYTSNTYSTWTGSEPGPMFFLKGITIKYQDPDDRELSVISYLVNVAFTRFDRNI